jgi:hypothetical protein
VPLVLGFPLTTGSEVSATGISSTALAANNGLTLSAMVEETGGSARESDVGMTIDGRGPVGGGTWALGPVASTDIRGAGAEAEEGGRGLGASGGGGGCVLSSVERYPGGKGGGGGWDVSDARRPDEATADAMVVAIADLRRPSIAVDGGAADSADGKV